jgi:SAM-dependent methyltransferase
MAGDKLADIRGKIKNHGVLYEHYRTIAYERANPFHPEYFIRDLDPSFAKLLPMNLNAQILDVGCGMGQFLRYLMLKGYRNLTGVELSLEQVEFCRKNGIPNVSLTTDVVTFLVDNQQRWDCIVFKDVIEHLPRKEVVPVLSAIFEALAPGGSVIIETGNLANPAGMFVRYIDFTHESGFTENSLRQILRAVGFDRITVRGNSPVIFSWRSYCRIVLQRTWYLCLKLMYSVDRGWDAAPTVLSPILIAHAVKLPT